MAKKSEQIKEGYRHGDVMIIPTKMTKTIGNALEEVKGSKVFAVHHNEVGHDHTLTSKGSRMVTLNGKEYLDIGAGAFLNHPEHGRLDVTAGLYEKRMEVEFDVFEQAMRQVID